MRMATASIGNNGKLHCHVSDTFGYDREGAPSKDGHHFPLFLRGMKPQSSILQATKRKSGHFYLGQPLCHIRDMGGHLL